MQEKIILFLLIGLSVAFLLERKPINIIFNFVGILITLAFIISIDFPDAQYFSFILIIIYTSALSILFGFIIMLNPNNLPKDLTLIQQLLVPLISSLVLLLYLLFETTPLVKILLSTNIGISLNDNIYTIYNTFTQVVQGTECVNDNINTCGLLHRTTYDGVDNSLSSLSFNQPTRTTYEEIEESIVEKIGRNLYFIPSSIIKFFIASLILLLALVSLFFILAI